MRNTTRHPLFPMHAHGHSWVNSTTGYQRSLRQGILPLGQNRSCLMKGFGFEREFGQGPSSQAWETINFPKAQNPHALLPVECSRGARATHTFWPYLCKAWAITAIKWNDDLYFQILTQNSVHVKQHVLSSMFADRTINHNSTQTLTPWVALRAN